MRRASGGSVLPSIFGAGGGRRAETAAKIREQKEELARELEAAEERADSAQIRTKQLKLQLTTQTAQLVEVQQQLNVQTQLHTELSEQLSELLAQREADLQAKKVESDAKPKPNKQLSTASTLVWAKQVSSQAEQLKLGRRQLAKQLEQLVEAREQQADTAAQLTQQSRQLFETHEQLVGLKDVLQQQTTLLETKKREAEAQYRQGGNRARAAVARTAVTMPLHSRYSAVTMMVQCRHSTVACATKVARRRRAAG